MGSRAPKRSPRAATLSPRLGRVVVDRGEGPHPAVFGRGGHPGLGAPGEVRGLGDDRFPCAPRGSPSASPRRAVTLPLALPGGGRGLDHLGDLLKQLLTRKAPSSGRPPPPTEIPRCPEARGDRAAGRLELEGPAGARCSPLSASGGISSPLFLARGPQDVACERELPDLALRLGGACGLPAEAGAPLSPSVPEAKFIAPGGQAGEPRPCSSRDTVSRSSPRSRPITACVLRRADHRTSLPACFF